MSRRGLLAVLLGWATTALAVGPRCDMTPDLLCRAGRTGTTNDAILSTTTDGTLSGADDGGFSLKLRGAADASFTTGVGMIQPGDGLGNIGNALAIPVEFAATPTLDNAGSILNVFTASEHRDWTVTADIAGGVSGGARGFVMAPTVKNSGARADVGFYTGLLQATQLQGVGAVAVGSSGAAGVLNAFQCGNTSNASTMTCTALYGLYDAPSINPGAGSATVTSRYGLYFANRGGTGTQTNAYGVYVEDQTCGTACYSLFSAGTDDSMVHKGSITGGTATGDDLTLRANTADFAVGGVINLNAPIGLYNCAPTTTATYRLLDFTPSFTQTTVTVRGFRWQPTIAVGTGVTASQTAVGATPTINFDPAGGVIVDTFQLFGGSPTFNWNSAPLTADLGIILPDILLAQPTVNAGNFTINTGSTRGVVHAPTFKNTGAAAALTVAYDRGIECQETLTPGTAGGTVTVTDRMCGVARDATFNGAGTEAITRSYGWYTAALSNCTNCLPFAAAEHTIKATDVPSTEVAWGAESGSPGRMYVLNDVEQITYVGMATWTGSGSGLAGATTYFPLNDRAAVGAEAGLDVIPPGSLKVYKMACALNAAPDNGGGVQCYTMSLRENAATVTPTCSITETSRSCTWCVLTPTSAATPCTVNATTPEAVSVNNMIALEAAVTGVPAAGVTDVTCTLWWMLDAF